MIFDRSMMFHSVYFAFLIAVLLLLHDVDARQTVKSPTVIDQIGNGDGWDQLNTIKTCGDQVSLLFLHSF
jgi:hypothetical protein